MVITARYRRFFLLQVCRAGELINKSRMILPEMYCYKKKNPVFVPLARMEASFFRMAWIGRAMCRRTTVETYQRVTVETSGEHYRRAGEQPYRGEVIL